MSGEKNASSIENPDSSAEELARETDPSQTASFDLIDYFQHNWSAFFFVYGVYGVLKDPNVKSPKDKAKQIALFAAFLYASNKLEKIITKYITNPIMSSLLPSNASSTDDAQEDEARTSSA